MDKKHVKFPAPKGFTTPEDSEPGKPFEVLATVALLEDGMLQLQALDGAALAEAVDEEVVEDTETPGFLGAIERGMPAA